MFATTDLQTSSSLTMVVQDPVLTWDVMIASFKTVSEVDVGACASFSHTFIPACEWVERDERNLACAQYGLLQKGTFEKEYS